MLGQLRQVKKSLRHLDSKFHTHITYLCSQVTRISNSLCKNKICCPDEVVQVAERICGCNHHPGSIPLHAETTLPLLDTKAVLGSIQPR